MTHSRRGAILAGRLGRSPRSRTGSRAAVFVLSGIALASDVLAAEAPVPSVIADAGTPPKAPAPKIAPARGIVVLKSGSSPVGLGVVLAQDGRILCSLSGLAGRETVTLQYADGSSTEANLTATDGEIDLALLKPKSGHWVTGLPPGHAKLEEWGNEAWGLADGHLKGFPIAVLPKESAGSQVATGAGLAALSPIALTGAPANAVVVGGPLVSSTGEIVALVTHPCPAEGKCETPLLAAPAGVLRQFLVKVVAAPTKPAPSPTTPSAPSASSQTPAAPTPSAAPKESAMAPRATPWLGIRAESESSGPTHGVRVLAIAPKSPAEAAGLHAKSSSSPADLVVAVNDQAVLTPEQLSAVIGQHAVGDVVRLLVMRTDHFRELKVTLEAPPLDGGPSK